MNLNKEDILELMKEFDESGLAKFEVEEGDNKLSFEKAVAKAVANTEVVIPSPQVETTPILANPTETKAPQATAVTEEVSGTPLKAPLAGTFYRQSQPGAAPYVSLGDTVEKGQIVGLIEAMKMMNEISAPASGVIKEIKLKNGEFADYGKVIMIIE